MHQLCRVSFSCLRKGSLIEATLPTKTIFQNKSFRKQKRVAFTFWKPWQLSQRRAYAKKAHPKSVPPDSKLDMEVFTPDRIRNFSIISHIDHGKTTLSTVLLQLSGTLYTTNETYLDKLAVERARGITVKAQTASLLYEHKGQSYLLNLIDTPGHVDFTYEVSRSLAACEGAFLLVDAVRGVQAQTVANFWLAYELNLSIVPVINKIDLPTAQPKVITEQLYNTFGFIPDDVLHISAKTYTGVESLFPAMIERIPPPKCDRSAPFKALLFDSWFGDMFSGVVCLIKLFGGSLKRGDKIVSAYTQNVYEVSNLGIMYPEERSTNILYAGQVGFVHLGMKSTKEAMLGDTFYFVGIPVEPIVGFKAPKPMVFAGIYPSQNDLFDKLKEAMEKLTLNDASVIYNIESSDALGLGYRCGFLGLLHMSVFIQRLKQEYGASVIATTPTVPYKFEMRNGEVLIISNPSDFPITTNILRSFEPIVNANVITPKEYMGPIIQLCEGKRGEQIDITFIDDSRCLLKYKLPLCEIISDFFDKLKELSSGYATLDYEESGYAEADLVKLTILLNGDSIDPLSIITLKTEAQDKGKDLVEKLKTVIHRQMFEIRIQAAVGSKIVASEKIKPFRKDVTAKCYGGDISRKKKLLEKQKEGKKRMRKFGNVEVPQEAFLVAFKKD